MKKLFLFIIVLLFSFNINAQITLEATYPNSAIVSGTKFSVILLDSSEYKYLAIDYNSSSFTLYNMDHSVYLNVTIPIAYYNSNYSIEYISRTLFDCDNTNIEYLLGHRCSPSPCLGGYVKIFRTDGTHIFYSDSAQATFSLAGSSTAQPIVNTPLGTKLVLNRYETDDIMIFSLCGHYYPYYSSNIINPINTDVPNSSSLILNNAYPNPAKDYINIEYILPKGYKNGTLLVFDITGNKVKEFKIDNSFNDLIINTNDFDKGTYIYKVKTGNVISKGKKFIVVD